jgi:hypothetical protein
MIFVELISLVALRVSTTSFGKRRLGHRRLITGDTAAGVLSRR